MTLAMWLWGAAAVTGLLALWALSRRGGRWPSRLFGGVLLALALLAAGLGTTLRHWHWLLDDVPVATISLVQAGPQRFEATLETTGEAPRTFELLGDEWQLDARVVRWTLPAQLGGLRPVWRLERLSGRYGDPKQDVEAERRVHDLRRDWDFWEVRQRWLADLPIADSRFGSATYLPMLDGARYVVSITPQGGLVAKPADERTEQLLDAAGW